MRIGVLTFHRAHNCGAMLQAWALKHILERMGHAVEFPTCNSVGTQTRFMSFVRKKNPLKFILSNGKVIIYNLLALYGVLATRKRYKAFRETSLPEREIEPKDFPNHYDLMIVGSDQVWSATHGENNYELFSGGILPKEVKRIAYAASYGDHPLNDKERMTMSKTLPTFTAISVREKAAQQELAQLTGRDIALTLDPTLLLTAEDYQSIAYRHPPKIPYLYVYWVSGTNDLLILARRLAKALNVKLLITPVYKHSWYDSTTEMKLAVSPDRMLAYTANAKYVLAASFHGTVFGLLNKKPFLSYMSERKGGTSRVESLLHQLGLEQRVITPETPLEEMLQQLQTPIPEDVYTEKLPALREQSIDWLKTALGK